MQVMVVRFLLCYIKWLKMFQKQSQTWFAVFPRVSRFTIAAITSFKVDTGSSVITWIFVALVYICERHQTKKLVESEGKRCSRRYGEIISSLDWERKLNLCTQFEYSLIHVKFTTIRIYCLTLVSFTRCDFWAMIAKLGLNFS